ncbi:hypothetical protein [Bartonella heixiaziensis]
MPSFHLQSLSLSERNQRAAADEMMQHHHDTQQKHHTKMEALNTPS